MSTIGDYVQALIEGPANLRFIVQPILAILLGIRDGRRDARLGAVPFVWRVFTQPAERRSMLGAALKAITVPLVIGVILDGVVQYLLFGRVRVVLALLVGALLVGFPYSASRGLANRASARRLSSRKRHRVADESRPPPP